MKTKAFQSSQLFYANPKWTSKQVHELRRFVRHKKVGMGLFRREHPKLYQVRKLRKARRALARLLSDLSAVQDLDVMLKTLRSMGGLTAQMCSVSIVNGSDSWDYILKQVNERLNIFIYNQDKQTLTENLVAF
jgi:hypothetical protein